MSKPIVNNSVMQCNKGSSPAVLLVTSQSAVKIASHAVATEKDSVFIQNIKPFGICSILQSPCSCVCTQWEKILEQQIEGSKQLSQDSYMECGVGGKIVFMNTGTNSFVDGETTISNRNKSEGSYNQSSILLNEKKANSNNENLFKSIAIVLLISALSILAVCIYFYE